MTPCSPIFWPGTERRIAVAATFPSNNWEKATDSPTSFRKPPKQQERLLDPEVAKAQNEALARQVGRAEMTSLRYQQHNRREGSLLHERGLGGTLPWRYLLPGVLGFAVIFLGPQLGMGTDRSLLVGVLSGFILVSFVFVQDAYRWLNK